MTMPPKNNQWNLLYSFLILESVLFLKKRVTTFGTYHTEILAPHSKVLCAQVIYH